MGALLNQSMFLILIGLLKGKTVALIVQDFRNVSAFAVSYMLDFRADLSPRSCLA